MRFRSGGELVTVDSRLPWALALLRRACGTPPPCPGEPTVRVSIDASRDAFPTGGMRIVSRDAYGDGHRVVLVDAGGSGFDLLVTVHSGLSVTARYRPRPAVRAANLALRHRFELLAGQVLVHYPVLWRAGWRGRVPVHAAVVRTGTGTPMLAGPAGVGKSTAVLAAGGAATADNLCCGDGVRCYGVAEPLRVGPGRRTDVEWPVRLPCLAPDRLVVLERGTDGDVAPVSPVSPVSPVAPVSPEEAARVLVAGTYAAGELRRYWAFAATLALATGLGPAHPPVERVAAEYARRLPCVRVRGTLPVELVAS
jgi:hypothetical protein